MLEDSLLLIIRLGEIDGLFPGDGLSIALLTLREEVRPPLRRTRPTRFLCGERDGEGISSPLGR